MIFGMVKPDGEVWDRVGEYPIPLFIAAAEELEGIGQSRRAEALVGVMQRLGYRVVPVRIVPIEEEKE